MTDRCRSRCEGFHFRSRRRRCQCCHWHQLRCRYGHDHQCCFCGVISGASCGVVPGDCNSCQRFRDASRGCIAILACVGGDLDLTQFSPALRLGTGFEESFGIAFVRFAISCVCAHNTRSVCLRLRAVVDVVDDIEVVVVAADLVVSGSRPLGLATDERLPWLPLAMLHAVTV